MNEKTRQRVLDVQAALGPHEGLKNIAANYDGVRRLGEIERFVEAAELEPEVRQLVSKCLNMAFVSGINASIIATRAALGGLRRGGN